MLLEPALLWVLRGCLLLAAILSHSSVSSTCSAALFLAFAALPPYLHRPLTLPPKAPGSGAVTFLLASTVVWNCGVLIMSLISAFTQHDTDSYWEWDRIILGVQNPGDSPESGGAIIAPAVVTLCTATACLLVSGRRECDVSAEPQPGLYSTCILRNAAQAKILTGCATLSLLAAIVVQPSVVSGVLLLLLLLVGVTALHSTTPATAENLSAVEKIFRLALGFNAMALFAE
jgi:hypothetical protein